MPLQNEVGDYARHFGVPAAWLDARRFQVFLVLEGVESAAAVSVNPGTPQPTRPGGLSRTDSTPHGTHQGNHTFRLSAGVSTQCVVAGRDS